MPTQKTVSNGIGKASSFSWTERELFNESLILAQDERWRRA